MLSSPQHPIADAFGRMSSTYDTYAVVQQKIAERLLSLLPIHLPNSPSHILEIGCGTGLTTNTLMKLYPSASYTITDISQNMLDHCQHTLSSSTNTSLRFLLLDAECDAPPASYDLIISSMNLQWLREPISSLHRLKTYLNPGGNLIYTTLGSKSFWQWHQSAYALNLPIGTMPLPTWPHLFFEETFCMPHPSTLDFFKGLKQLGAYTPHSSYQRMTPTQLKALCHFIDGHYDSVIDWHIVYGKMNYLSS